MEGRYILFTTRLLKSIATFHSQLAFITGSHMQVGAQCSTEWREANNNLSIRSVVFGSMFIESRVQHNSLR